MPERKLTILQVHNVQLHRGGADVVLDRERDLLLAHGHQVPRFVVENREIENIGKLRAGLKAIWNREAIRQVQAAIVQHQPDVAHVHTPFPLLSPAVFRGIKSQGIPTVETVHSYRFSCINALFYREGKVCESCVGKKFSWPAIAHKCYKDSAAASTALASSLALHHLIGTFQHHVDAYLTLTDFAREKLLAEGFPAEKVLVKPNFVLGPQQPGAGGGQFAMFVGRLVPEKGIRTVVKAWQNIDPAMRLVIIGEGPLLPELQALAADMPNIEFHPWMPNADVLEKMRQAEFVVFSSEIYEAGPLVLMEAYSCGTPVVASDVGNFTTLVHPDRTGVRYRCGDADDLARQVNRLIEHPHLLQGMRQHAFQEYLERYSPEVNYGLLMDVYQRVMQSPIS